ncbi:hypothetical protein AVEN_195268-1 [Araneus ventricosus]|uniref:RNase H type-1 domain-containing protein n=1 Tax=Araneus ventricosus TaxID=182803 RepID=A0A4Y2UN80_ARAVE|nr:hypothetical protein AVEN_195268-1 [Araneus ventricosus]
MYGSEIWYRDIAIINRKILSLQRNALRNITKTYKTVSTLSIQVRAGIPPLDLSIKFHQEKFRLIKLKTDILKNNELLIANNVNVPPPRVPPWRGRRIFWNIEQSNVNMNNEFNFNYYTDGSKINGRTSCGIALFRGGEEIKTRSIRLNNDSSVFMAEAYAIKIAPLEAQSLNDSTIPVHIFTDSMSVLKSLEAVNDRFQIITDINFREFKLFLSLGKGACGYS